MIYHQKTLKPVQGYNGTVISPAQSASSRQNNPSFPIPQRNMAIPDPA
jgi:hypothetical protein